MRSGRLRGIAVTTAQRAPPSPTCRRWRSRLAGVTNLEQWKGGHRARGRRSDRFSGPERRAPENPQEQRIAIGSRTTAARRPAGRRKSSPRACLKKWRWSTVIPKRGSKSMRSAAYSAWMPASLITRVHFAVSDSSMQRTLRACCPRFEAVPSSFPRRREARGRAAIRLSFAMTSAGVFAATRSPASLPMRSPADRTRPPSELRMAGERLLALTAIARSLPLRTCGSRRGHAGERIRHLPPMRSSSQGRRLCTAVHHVHFRRMFESSLLDAWRCRCRSTRT